LKLSSCSEEYIEAACRRQLVPDARSINDLLITPPLRIKFDFSSILRLCWWHLEAIMDESNAAEIGYAEAFEDIS
jgi:hypothetical protein